MSKLSGKIAVVTGGTGGLGRIVVDYLLREGATVVVTHTGKKESINFLIEKKNNYPLLDERIVDITDEQSVESFYQWMKDRYSRVDILCNLAGGVSGKKNIEDVSLQDWDAMMRLNLYSAFLMMKNAVRSMKANGFGRIINIAAMAGIIPEKQRGGYGAAKAAVIALTGTAAEEVANHRNVTVNVIVPGSILTDENKKWGTPEEMKDWITPVQIAERIVDLCEESGAMINGQTIQMYGKG